MEQPRFEVDLDNEKIFVDNRWLSRTELAGALTERLASMDYSVGNLSAAIEQLDETLAVIEAMKMQYSICAPRDGKVQEILYGVGDQVLEGQPLLVMDGAS